MRDDAISAIRLARDKRWQGLMRAAQDGDNAAYSRLLEELVPALRAMVRRKWHNPNDVEDIVQEILLSVHSVRHTYDPARPFSPWLATIVSRRIADAARRASARSANETTVETMPETYSGLETKSQQDVSDDGHEVRRALAALPAAQRRAVELMKLEGLSLAEASYATGKSVASLKITVHRAMKAMQRMLE